MPRVTFSVPGTPPSVNHLYEATLTRGPNGVRRGVRKSPGVESYQIVATLVARAALPANWKDTYSEGYVRLRYWFYLRREIDCDNALKALNDALAKAFGINDRKFLPYVVDKFVGKNEDPHVVVQLEWDEPGVRGGQP